MSLRQYARDKKRSRPTNQGPRRWRSTLGVGAGALMVAAVVFAACGSASNPEAKAAISRSVALHAYRLSTGQRVLVNAAGHALYMFVPDDQKTVSCGVVCLRSWPLVFVPSGTRPEVGAGVDAKLVGTLTSSQLDSGDVAVTYNRWPLYTYADDVSPGMTSGQGTDLNGGYWYLIQTNGRPLVPPGDPAP
jgi:predicted lipoprotein with Yx(FWY)xxD motif